MSNLIVPDREEWPWEALVQFADEGGQIYSQFAKDNGDGTVSIIDWGETPPVERTFPKNQVALQERDQDKSERWSELYEKVYPPKRSNL